MNEPAAPDPSEEPETYLRDHDVVISSLTFTHRGHVTMPIAAISYFAISRPISYLALALAALAVLVFAVGSLAVQLFPHDVPDPTFGVDLWPLILIATGFLLLFAAVVHFFRSYVLIVAAHSGDRVVVKDGYKRLLRIRAALEVAVTRGWQTP